MNYIQRFCGFVDFENEIMDPDFAACGQVHSALPDINLFCI